MKKEMPEMPEFDNEEHQRSILKVLEHTLGISNKHQDKIYWYEEFAEYIEKNNISLYNEAASAADYLEANGYFTDEEKKKWGME